MSTQVLQPVAEPKPEQPDKDQLQVVEGGKSQLKFYERWILNVLKLGDIPRHMAFIMDGNRRFAKSINLKPKMGHKFGFDALLRCLEWCLHLQVKVVSVFAFSIENFQRSKEEVDFIMEIGKNNLKKLSEHQNFFDKNQIQIKICGDISLCDSELQVALRQCMDSTKNNTKLLLNICFSYNSTHEIEYAASNIIKQVQEGKLRVQDVNYQVFWNNLYISDAPDIVVRTSNEIRLSNFMTVQSTFS